MYDVAIIGGGPGGSTTGTLLKKYNPKLRVLILEKETFPREHIGESQLPPICEVLQEMGCWEDIEKAGFPIKLGATYTWGKTRTPWRFEFLPLEQIPDSTVRPGKFEGWRKSVAFQVDRAIYDDVLLKHSQKMGCEVRQNARVSKIERDGDKVTGLGLDTGEVITARYYVDASGYAAVLRKAMGIGVTAPTLLRNVAFWDYWEDPKFAADADADMCRIHIRSLPYGWMWFIRIGKTRISVGVVCPAEYYKGLGKRPEEVYEQALKDEEFVAAKLATAKRDGTVRATNDWSFVVDRTYGENWFLVGECAGFADPILSAGLTLTHAGGRELAYTIMELDRGEHDRDWLVTRFDELQTRRVRQHMKFAEFWYSANGYFEVIRENCAKIATESGLKLNPSDAFRWLSFGGVGDDIPGHVGLGGQDVASMKQVLERFTGEKAGWVINGKNVFKLNLAGAKESTVGLLENGRIERAKCYVRGEKQLPIHGLHGLIAQILMNTSDATEMLQGLHQYFSTRVAPQQMDLMINRSLQVLEVLANEFWVMCDVNKKRPMMNVSTPDEGFYIFTAGKYPGQKTDAVQTVPEDVR